MKIDKEMVCPHCYRPVDTGVVWANGKNRRYISHCCMCGISFEVVQFLNCDKWVIEKYRDFAGVPRPLAWQQVCKVEAATPALVMTGPGGDFTKGYTPMVYGVDLAAEGSESRSCEVVVDSAMADRVMSDIKMIEKKAEFTAELVATIKMTEVNLKKLRGVLEKIK